MSTTINLSLALDANQELSLDDLDLVLGGGANNVSAAGAGDDEQQHGSSLNSSLADHAGHVGTIVGAGAAVGGAIGGTLGIPGGPAGITAGAAFGGAVGGAAGVFIAIGNEMYEHGQVIIDAASSVVDVANHVAEFYATGDVG